MVEAEKDLGAWRRFAKLDAHGGVKKAALTSRAAVIADFGREETRALSVLQKQSDAAEVYILLSFYCLRMARSTSCANSLRSHSISLGRGF